MRDTYYEEEMRYLLDAGKEFSKAFPDRARYLNLDNVRARDPHVERLIEAFAFLAGRIRRKLDDDLPELSQSLMAVLWPHYLRPIPAMAILEFRPVEGMIEATQTIPRGTEIDSDPVAGGRPCRFRTCYDVDIQPISIADAKLASGVDGVSLRLHFQIEKGIDLSKLNLTRLRMYLHGDPATTYATYRLLRREIESITVKAETDASAEEIVPGKIGVQMAGFAGAEELLRYESHSFPGYRLLQEYFYFPEKFLFFDICDLQTLARLGTLTKFHLDFALKSQAPVGLRLSRDNFRLYCTPIVNLFRREAEPIRVDHMKTEYPVVADFDAEEKHCEVYSVDSVEGITSKTGKRRDFAPFLSFKHEAETESGATQGQNAFYHISRRISPWGGWDTFISLLPHEGKAPSLEGETLSLDLTCTNGALAKELHIGEIRHPTQGTPEFVRFSNITQPTPSLWPSIGEAVEWQFISHLSLNYLSLTTTDALQEVLRLYDFGKTEGNQRRIAGIRKISSSPKELLLNGAVIRGISITLELDETHFADEGDLELFASVLHEFFALYASINAFTQLTVRCIPSETALQWAPTLGRQMIL